MLGTPFAGLHPGHVLPAVLARPAALF